MKSKFDLIQKWIGFANDDLQAARKLFSDQESLYKIVCYHCQQCAEKILKAYLLQLDLEMIKSHDLEKLVTEIYKIDKEIEIDVDSMIQLSRYAEESRCPDDFVDISKEETTITLENASKVFQYFQNRIEGKLQNK